MNTMMRAGDLCAKRFIGHHILQKSEGPVRSMRQAKKFAVVGWVRKTDAFKAVREQLVSLADDEPDESTEYEGMVDFHWWFDSHAETAQLLDSFREISDKPEIVVLRLSC